MTSRHFPNFPDPAHSLSNNDQLMDSPSSWTSNIRPQLPLPRCTLKVQKMNETTIDGDFLTWVRGRDFLTRVLLTTCSICISSWIYAIFLIFANEEKKRKLGRPNCGVPLHIPHPKASQFWWTPSLTIPGRHMVMVPKKEYCRTYAF